MDVNIALLAGDGIGPEIIAEATKVLDRVAAKFGHRFDYREALVGACAIDATGDPYPDETHAICQAADAVLFGAIGDPKYDNDPKAPVRPEQGLLRMRKSLGLFANLRPIALFDTLTSRSPLKAEVVRGTDFICVRELTSGIYFGRQGRDRHDTRAYDTCTYTIDEIEQVLRVAFRLAGTRRRHLTVVDKANVLETSRMWRETAQRTACEYPDVTVDFMFVDNAAMQIVRQPTHFDVIVTENMFGDILTDEASVISGSLGERRVGSGALRADPRLLSAGCGEEHRQPDGHDPLGRHAARTPGARQGRQRRTGRRRQGTHRRRRHRRPRRTGRTPLLDLRGRGLHRRAYLGTPRSGGSYPQKRGCNLCGCNPFFRAGHEAHPARTATPRPGSRFISRLRIARVPPGRSPSAPKPGAGGRAGPVAAAAEPQPP